jgi:hypothetical protein
MSNLKEETLHELETNGKTASDVLWVGSPEWGWFSFEEFLAISDFEYDSGYGAQHIAKDLYVVGEDFWLERGEYDGAESWDYKKIIVKPENHKIPKSVGNNDVMWNTLKDINSKRGK